MGSTQHIVFDLRNEDGTSRPCLMPERFADLLHALHVRNGQENVTFQRSHGDQNVIVMNVTGRESHDVEHCTWMRRQAEEFARGYISALRFVTQPIAPTLDQLEMLSGDRANAEIDAAIKRVKKQLAANSSP